MTLVDHPRLSPLAVCTKGFVLSLILGCGKPVAPSPAKPAETAPAPSVVTQNGLSDTARAGRRVMAKAQCNRCHSVSDTSGRNLGMAPVRRSMHCVNCHTWILGTKGKPDEIARYKKRFPKWEQYLVNIRHLQKLPDLGTLTRKVRPGFIRSFLDGPFDLRPHLEESMIPLRLSASDKDAVVQYLTELNHSGKVPEPAVAHVPAAQRVARGKQAFVARGCVTCHLVGNLRLSPAFGEDFYRAVAPTAPLAPNLRYAHRRMTRQTLVRYIHKPTDVDPMSTMPSQSVSKADAEAIADFLIGVAADADGSLDDSPPAIPKPRVLNRTVAFQEVYREVFGKICIHCHMDPKNPANRGDGGAGNVGGLGFAGVGLELETYAGIQRGLIRGGKRVSILVPEQPGEAPLLVKVLLRRHREAGRDFRRAFADRNNRGAATSPRRPGMPLGLPPLEQAQLDLIATWIAQGAPGP